MNLESVLLPVGELRSTELADAVRELAEAVGHRSEASWLQVHASLDHLSPWRGRALPSSERGLLVLRTRMLGLPEPTLSVGVSSPGVRLGGNEGPAIHVLMLYVGSPVPSERERKVSARISALLDDENAVRKLEQARTVREAGDVFLTAAASRPTAGISPPERRR